MTPECLLCTYSKARIMLEEIQRGLGYVSALKREHSNWGEERKMRKQSDNACCPRSICVVLWTLSPPGKVKSCYA